MRDAGRLQQAEEFLRAAIELHVKLAADFPDEPKQRDLLCWFYRRLGEMLKAEGRLDEAEAAYRQAIEVQQDLLAEYPDSVDFIEELEEVYVLLSDLLRTTDRVEQADDLLAKARTLWERLPDLASQPQERETLHRAHVQLGKLLSGIGRHEEAIAVFRQEVAVREALHASDPSASRRHHLGQSYHFLGRELQRAGRMDEAKEAYRSAIDVYATLVADYPGNSSWRGALGESYRLLAGFFSEIGDSQDLEHAVSQEIQVQRTQVAKLPRTSAHGRQLAYYFRKLAQQMLEAGRPELAEESLRAAIDVHNKFAVEFPDDPKQRDLLCWSYRRLGEMLKAEGRLDDAEAAYRQAIAGQEALLAEYPDSVDFIEELEEVYVLLSDLLRTTGRAEQADDLLAEARTLWERLPDLASPKDREILNRAHKGLVKLLSGVGRHEEASMVLRQAVTVDPGNVESFRQMHAAYMDLASELRNTGRLENAETIYRQLADQYGKLESDLPDDAAGCRAQLGDNFQSVGHAFKEIGLLREAEAAYGHAISVREKLPDSGMALPGGETLSATSSGHWCVVSNFDGGGVGGRKIFNRPTWSATSIHLKRSPNLATVTDQVPAFDGDKVCKVRWQWLDSHARRWLRLTTHRRGNPTIHLRMPVRVRLRLDSGALRVCLGIRETGVDVPLGANGGTKGTIEWVGAESVIDGAPQGVLVTAKPGVWQTLTFIPRPDNVKSFTGDGVLHAENDKGVFEHLAFAAVDHAGPFTVYIDAIEQACPAPDAAGGADGEGSDDDNDGGDGRAEDGDG
jgi:tetratricopeptide (TPR) repeat protein